MKKLAIDVLTFNVSVKNCYLIASVRPRVIIMHHASLFCCVRSQLLNCQDNIDNWVNTLAIFGMDDMDDGVDL